MRTGISKFIRRNAEPPIAVVPGLALLLLGAAAPARSPDAAFAEHVRAIEARDLAALEKTVTSGPTLTLILPDGSRTYRRRDYLDVHKRLFATAGWSLTFEIVTKTATRDLAVFTTRSTYVASPASSHASVNWVTLIFRREGGGWRLVHDQNTRANPR